MSNNSHESGWKHDKNTGSQALSPLSESRNLNLKFEACKKSISLAPISKWSWLTNIVYKRGSSTLNKDCWLSTYRNVFFQIAQAGPGNKVRAYEVYSHIRRPFLLTGVAHLKTCLPWKFNSRKIFYNTTEKTNKLHGVSKFVLLLSICKCDSPV